MTGLSELPVGSRIWFEGERNGYTIQARDARFLVCTKPFAIRQTVIYTIVDLKQKIRGTENLVFGMGFETKTACEEALARLASDETQVSHRNRVGLRIKATARPKE